MDVGRTYVRANPRHFLYAYVINIFGLQDFYSSQLPSRFIPVKDDEMTHDLINDGNYAIIGRIVGSIYFPEDDVLNEDLKVRELQIA